MKYVVVSSLGVEVPRIFSELESHVDQVRPHQTVIAAGFCRFNTDNGKLVVYCWGQSFTLKANSRNVIDEKLILKHNEFSA
jgi:hypothetical protein